jgi:hypothetical protein
MFKKNLLTIALFSLLLIPFFSSTACAEFGESVETWYVQKVIPVVEEEVSDKSWPKTAWYNFESAAPATAAFIARKVLSRPGYLKNLAEFALSNPVASKILKDKVSFDPAQNFATSHLAYLDEWGPNAWKAYTAFWVYIDAKKVYAETSSGDDGTADDDEQAAMNAALEVFNSSAQKAFGEGFPGLTDEYRWLAIRIHDAELAGMNKKTAMLQWKKLFSAMAAAKNWEEVSLK